MPYQNQKLTSSERRDLLRYRIDNGYPLHAPPHLIREEGYFLITAATHQHSVVLDTPKRRSLFEVQLINELQVAKAEVTAWVVLPNHYHVLLSVPNLNQISSAIRLLHGRTSRRWNLEDSLTNQRKV